MPLKNLDFKASSPSSGTSATDGETQLYYITCSFCSIILAVGVPRGSLSDIVTIRCGRCTNIWSVNMASGVSSLATDLQHQQQLLQHRRHDGHHQQKNGQTGGVTAFRSRQNATTCSSGSLAAPSHGGNNLGSSGGVKRKAPATEEERTSAISCHKLLDKKQRIPSAYNQFIREEIQRIKANNPDISHKEAFSTAAKNWAHYPHIRMRASYAEQQRF